MLERSRSIAYAEDIIVMSRIRQLVYWGSAPAVALALAVIAVRSESDGAHVKRSARLQASQTSPRHRSTRKRKRSGWQSSCAFWLPIATV